jgi:hypothetical protein
MSRNGTATKAQDSNATAFATPPSILPSTGAGGDKYLGGGDSVVKKPSAATVLFPESTESKDASDIGWYTCVYVYFTTIYSCKCSVKLFMDICAFM